MNINLKYHYPLRPYGKCVVFRGKGLKRWPEEQSAESGATKANYAINRCLRTVRIARQTRSVENKHFPYSLDLFVNFLDQAKKFETIKIRPDFRPITPLLQHSITATHKNRITTKP